MHEEAMHGEFDGHVPQSFLMYMFSALGIKYSVLLPASALLAFVVVMVLMIRGRGNALTGALLFVVPLPLLIGCFGVVEGLVASFQVIATSSTSPRPAEIGQAVSMSLMTAFVGAALTVPSYVVAAIGLVLRAILGEPLHPERLQPPKT